MAIVPFLLGETISIDEDSYGGSGDENEILILDADRIQIEGFTKGTESNTSYDLRIGGQYWDVRSNVIIPLGDGCIQIRPKMFVEIETMERVRFPKTRAGRISSKVSILRKGLGVFHTNVDPGYNGHLVIYVCNFGNDVVELRKGDKFCALKIETVEGEANPYRKEAKRPAGRDYVNNRERFGRFLKNYMYIIFIAIQAISTALMLLLTYIINRSALWP